MRSSIIPICREDFIKSLTDLKEDRFARTFISKCDMIKAWNKCWGIWEDGKVVAAIVTTYSRYEPKVANLQLLHTFAKYRNRGYAKLLCEEALFSAIYYQCKYFRVSAEPQSVEFYKKIGFIFIGKQKKCFLSMFSLTSTKIECNRPILDSVIEKAIYSKRKGGCVEVFGDAFK